MTFDAPCALRAVTLNGMTTRQPNDAAAHVGADFDDFLDLAPRRHLVETEA